MEKFIKAFHLTAEKAELFFEICKELKANTEVERLTILEAMADLGQIGFVVETPKTKEEYIKHLKKQYGSVLDVAKESQNGRTSPR